MNSIQSLAVQDQYNLSPSLLVFSISIGRIMGHLSHRTLTCSVLIHSPRVRLQAPPATAPIISTRLHLQFRRQQVCLVQSLHI